MPRGGHSRSGRTPDPNALRRDRTDDKEWVTLPAEGRSGPPPPWPLTKPTARESAIWVRLWAMPQAVEWERQSLDLTVALYVRRLTVAERRNAPANAVTVVRQLADALGLTSPGMRANRWRLGRAKTDTPTERATVTPIRPTLR